jgi:hypothetical protein
MSIPKKMHFVPQTYLKRFATRIDNDLKIHFVHKNNFLMPIRRPVALRNICAEKYLYSIAKPGQKNDPAVENLLAEVFDAEFNKIYEALTDGNLVELSDLDLYGVVAWATSMFLRNRQMKYFLLDSFEETFTRKYEKAMEDGKEVFIHRNHEIAIHRKTLDELKLVLEWDKPYLNGILFPQIAETTLKWLNNSIITLVKLKTDAEFITSDNPLTIEWSKDGNGVPNGGHVRCIPLDSKHLLKISPNHDGKNPLVLHRVSISPEHESLYALARNQIQFKLCSFYMLGSHSSLSRFQNQMKPILKEIYR